MRLTVAYLLIAILVVGIAVTIRSVVLRARRERERVWGKRRRRR